LPIRVRAKGYQPVELWVVPDRDRSLIVTLVPLPAVAGAAPIAAGAGVAKSAQLAPRAPAVAPSGVIRRYPF